MRQARGEERMMHSRTKERMCASVQQLWKDDKGKVALQLCMHAPTEPSPLMRVPELEAASSDAAAALDIAGSGSTAATACANLRPLLWARSGMQSRYNSRAERSREIEC